MTSLVTDHLPDSVNLFSATSLFGQEVHRSLLDIKLERPGSKEAIEVLLDDEEYVPEDVEKYHVKYICSCLERLKNICVELPHPFLSIYLTLI